jgi:D-glycero-alpha-D-manno-heptose-7-phosphate kinase
LPNKIRLIESRAPNRVLDFGGWTDTHFAGRGRVVNLAVNLFAHVTIVGRDGPGATVHVLDYGDQIEVSDVVKQAYGTKHDLLLAALKVMPVGMGVDLYITADVPPGCSTGSSAAITVSLLIGLSTLAGKPLVPHELARLAHRIETEELDNECGIQDQIASAYGGLNYIAMDSYPEADVSPIYLSEELLMDLESRLLLVYEGAGHLSSDVHRKVIDALAGPGSKTETIMDGLRDAAEAAKNAFLQGDLGALAEIMNENNRLQKALHPSITTERIEEIENIARSHGAIGAMINGAGGGGSITLLCRPGARAKAAQALRAQSFTILPFTICRGQAQAWTGKY